MHSTRLRSFTGVITVALAACSAGTKSNSSVAAKDSAGGNVDAVPAAGAQRGDTSFGPANHMGRIPVLEYHVITDGKPNTLYTRNRQSYWKDMETLYAKGYRPITMKQLLDKDFSEVPAGMSPVVFVFDDASPSQFRYIDRGNGKLDIDSMSAVGTWLSFAKTHPGWNGKAVFCMLNGGSDGHNFFGDGPKWDGQHGQWRFQKVKWLADNGFELCDHTLWHAELSKYSDAVVQEQIARNLMGIDSAVPGYKVRTMALPKGLWPKNRPLAWQGTYTYTDKKTKATQTVNYKFDAVLEVAGGPAKSPYDPTFDPHSVSRIEMNGTQFEDALAKLDKTKSRFIK
ncbi:MAG TPA: polysaccharide deacetylase family protein [Gemmatimonadaceae bacterium]